MGKTNFTKQITGSREFTVNAMDNEQFTINICDCKGFTINISGCQNYTINEEDVRKEKQGKLLKLPCAVGDTVYYRYDGIKIAPMRVEQIIIAQYGINLLLEYCGNDKQLKYWRINIENTAFDCGIIFLTREEAEAALKRMEV